jgi:hypothetical protein
MTPRRLTRSTATVEDIALGRIDMRLEKTVEAVADRTMENLGFEVVRFSTKRPRLKGSERQDFSTRQTPGIADRLYIHRERRLAVWWEAKAAYGRQSADQKRFQAQVESVGWNYVLGTDDDLAFWLVHNLDRYPVARAEPAREATKEPPVGSGSLPG